MATAAGLKPIHSPVLRIEFNRAEFDFLDAGALVFTSANGVRAIANVNIDAVAAIPVFAVGKITAEEARKSGFRSVTAAGGDVESLCSEVLSAASAGMFAGDVVHPVGADHRGDLVGALNAAGVRSRRIQAYKAVEIEKLSEEARAALYTEPPAEWIALFSPRSAELFLKQADRAGLAGCLKGSRAACLSDAVAAVAAKAKWKEINVSTAKSAAALMKMAGA